MATAEDKKPSSFEKASVTGIEFTLAGDNLDQFGFTLSGPVMRERIINNLAGWNFPIGPDPEKTRSHSLVASIGRVTHQSTPVGFSFSAGDSDPRAPEFQKADVITVNCRLTSINNAQQSAEQSMDFAANPITEALTKRKNEAKAADLLVDHISTVCFNLLDDLQLQDLNKPDGKPAAKPGWMPEIRIETLEQPAAERDKGDKTETVKPGESSNESRKQIIIHNQGTPVILKLGHDRL